MSDARPLILIVDDQSVNLKVLAGSLRPNFVVEMATNGMDALALSRRAPTPDLILLDVMMPGMDGYAVCTALKADPLTAEIPVIFITARTDAQSETQALVNGAVDFIKKPINPSVVALRVGLHLQLRQREQALRESKQQLEIALEAGAMALWDYDRATGMLTWSERHTGLLGLAPAQRSATLRAIREAIHPKDRRACLGHLRRTMHEAVAFDQVYRVVWPDGSLHWLHSLGQVMRDPRGIAYRLIGTSRDVSAVKTHQHQLEHLAHHDVLTGLPNRLLLRDRLGQAMARARRNGVRIAVLYLDLQGFKAINDAEGHVVGDQLLKTVADRMQQTLRAVDTLAHLGGDEFAAVLVDLAESDDCLTVGARLIATAVAPVRVGALELQVTASLGITLYPQVGDVDGDALLRQADRARYRAKQAGTNQCYLHQATLWEAPHA